MDDLFNIRIPGERFSQHKHTQAHTLLSRLFGRFSFSLLPILFHLKNNNNNNNKTQSLVIWSVDSYIFFFFFQPYTVYIKDYGQERGGGGLYIYLFLCVFFFILFKYKKGRSLVALKLCVVFFFFFSFGVFMSDTRTK